MKKMFLIVSALVIASFLNDAYAARRYNQYRTHNPVGAATLSINNASSYKLKITSPCFTGKKYLDQRETGHIPLINGVYQCNVTVTAVDAPEKKANFKFNAKSQQQLSKDSSGLDSIKGEGLNYGIQDLR